MAVKHGFFIIKDNSLPVGSRLFGGSDIYMWVNRCIIAAQVQTDANYRPNQEMEINMSATLEDKRDVGSMWNRRKSHIQITGMPNMQVNLSGAWEVSQVGSADIAPHYISNPATGQITEPAQFGVGSPLRFTPYVGLRMAMSGHTFHIRGGTALRTIIEGQANDFKEGTQVGTLYNTGSGMPVVVNTFNCEDVATMEDYVTWNLGLSEDKDWLK